MFMADITGQKKKWQEKGQKMMRQKGKKNFSYLHFDIEIFHSNEQWAC